MSFINVFISKPCKINVRNRQLVVTGETEHTFPIDDMNVLLLETGECNLTVMALRALTDAGVAVFVCDGKHLPAGVLLPFKTYYRPLKILNLQLSMPKPMKKQLWQSVIKQKIYNQAMCLMLCGKEEQSNYLFDLSKVVISDDARNSEAVAASYYFRKLFGEEFTRGDDNIVNAMLNYGYTLVRGIIARTLSACGFETSIGLHHINQFNNFNLADDLIEPYRPVVDLIVYNLPKEKEMTTAVKRKLFSVFNTNVDMCGEKHNLSYAVELTVESLRAVLEGSKETLVMPKIVPIENHRYE